MPWRRIHAGRRRGQGFVRGLHRTDGAGFELLDVVRIDPAGERIRTPQTEGIRPFMVMRGTDEHVLKARQLGTDRFGHRQKQADHIHADQGDLRRAVRQDDGAGHQRIVNPGGLAVFAESGQVNGLFLRIGRDVRFAESDLEIGRGRRGE
jgi:hypothetical protein